MSKQKLKIAKRDRIKINKQLTYSSIGPHEDSYHSLPTPARVQQTTHWYATKFGWTAQPIMASYEEVERRGLHDCQWQGCEQEHFGSAEEFVQNRIIREAAQEWAESKKARQARKAKSGRRAVRGQKLEKR